MELQWERTETLHRLQIAGDMTIYTALELKQQLVASLTAGPALEVDLSAVSELDTAGLQQLVLARRQAMRSGRPWRLVAMSAAVQEVLALLRLEDYFTGSDADPERRQEAEILSEAAAHAEG